MTEIVRRSNPSFYRFSASQDKLRWRRFMEGVVSKEMAAIQGSILSLHGSPLTLKAWKSGLVIKFLDVTHGQWLYRNLKAHDTLAGLLVTEVKEELQADIEE